MDLNQVTVPTRDVERSVAFYQQLGLHLIVKSPHYARFECLPGGSTFSVHLAEELPTGAGVKVYFEREDLDEYVAVLVEKGIEFEDLPNDKRWEWREAHLYDPDGNHLVIYRAGKVRRYPDWRIPGS